MHRAPRQRLDFRSDAGGAGSVIRGVRCYEAHNPSPDRDFVRLATHHWRVAAFPCEDRVGDLLVLAAFPCVLPRQSNGGFVRSHSQLRNRNGWCIPPALQKTKAKR